MRSEIEDVREAFAQLAGHETPLGRVAVTDTGVQVEHGPVVLALDHLGRRCVLVPSERSPQPDKASRGVSLGVAEYVHPDLERTRYLVLRCELEGFADLFASIASDVLRAVEADLANPEKSCYQVLERYRDLFGPAESDLLGARSLAAIFAELVVLDAVVAAGGHVAQWKGPERHRHDVIGPDAAIEVKSTLSAEHRRVVIHGTRQLEPPPDRRLFLHLVRLEPAIGGESVQDLVEQIVDRGGDPSELRRLLALVGYQYVDADQYATVQFSVLDSEAHEVDESFPRLAPEVVDDLPPGVSELRYMLDLTATDRRPLPNGLEDAADMTADR